MRTALTLAALALAARADAQPARGWDLRLPAHVALAVGQTQTLPIAIAVDRGLSISRDAALIVDLAPDGGVTVKRRLGRADAVDPDADAPRFEVPLHAAAAGDFRLAVRVRFWLCGTRSCRPIDARRAVAVAIAPAAPPRAAPPAPAAPPRDAGRRRR